MRKLLGQLTLVGVVALLPNLSFAALSPEEGTFSLIARSGVAPTTFNKDARFTSTVNRVNGPAITPGSSDTTGPLFGRKSKTVAFSKLYTMPFFLGFDLAYMTSNCFEIFANFDLSHACAKDVNIITNIGQNTPIAPTTVWKVRDTTNFGFYLGARHFFRPYRCVLPFVGAKLGMKGQTSCGVTETATLRANPDLNFVRIKGRTCSSLSAGLQAGVEWQISCNYFMVFTSEMIGTSARYFDSNLQIHKTANTTGAASSIGRLGFGTQVTRNPRATISFPLTLGLRVRL